MKSNSLTIIQRTITVTDPKNMPRKKKKRIKKAMALRWYEEPIDPIEANAKLRYII